MRKERLELSHLTILDPKSSASTNSATFAYGYINTAAVCHIRLPRILNNSLGSATNLPWSAAALLNTYTIQNWGGRRGLNPRPPESQSGALPTELRPPLNFCLSQIGRLMVRPTGIEPVTPGLEGRCSIRLSYGRSTHLPYTNHPMQLATQCNCHSAD